MRVRSRIKLMPHQARFVRWRAPQDVLRDGFAEKAILGYWGSAKTMALMAEVLTVAAENPWTPEYGPLVPRIVVTGPVDRTVVKVIMPKFRQVCPRELIRRVRGKPYPSVELINGCTIDFASFEAVIEGDDLVGVAVDEVHKMTDPTQLQNLRNRCRDPFASRRQFMAAGLPESGWVRETFDTSVMPEHERRRRFTLLVATAQNTHLPKAHAESVMSSAPSIHAQAITGDKNGDGVWLPPLNALYAMFDARRHVVPYARYRADRPIAAVGLDVGRSSAAVLVQEEPGPVVLVVDEIIAHASSVEDLASAVKASHGPRLRQGYTRVAVDPTIRDDELDALYRVLPGLEIVKRGRTDPFYAVEPGIRMVQAALLNARGETRLFFTDNLKIRRGILDSMQNTKFSERTGARVKDNTRDHAEDALRYAVNAVLGDRGFAPSLH